MKVKHLLLGMAFSLAGLNAGVMNAQDIITKTNGDDIKVKVMKITDTQIEYKDFDFQDGPIRSISTENVFMITFANGQKEVFKRNDVQNINKINENPLVGTVWEDRVGGVKTTLTFESDEYAVLYGTLCNVCTYTLNSNGTGGVMHVIQKENWLNTVIVNDCDFIINGNELELKRWNGFNPVFKKKSYTNIVQKEYNPLLGTKWKSVETVKGVIRLLTFYTDNFAVFEPIEKDATNLPYACTYSINRDGTGEITIRKDDAGWGVRDNECDFILNGDVLTIKRWHSRTFDLIRIK
ncbi:MAG: hypothetical protein LBR17_03480 [Bacteroidales bacterium]|jgi:hypothetical protein|nr:hypothetical protein [Bacteroidales bacterium]